MFFPYRFTYIHLEKGIKENYWEPQKPISNENKSSITIKQDFKTLIIPPTAKIENAYDVVYSLYQKALFNEAAKIILSASSETKPEIKEHLSSANQTFLNYVKQEIKVEKYNTLLFKMFKTHLS
jgi:hypothetical protein